jgi:DNA-binding response OmpR family regulator
MENEGRILIIDESMIDVRIVKRVLSNAGFDVVVSQEGEDIVEKAKHDSFDLILLDIMVPDFKGFDVCKALKEDPFTGDVPIIFLTARYELSMFMKGFEVGGEDYIRKPLIMTELISRVKSQIELASARKIQFDLVLELQKAKDEIKILKDELNVQKQV